MYVTGESSGDYATIKYNSSGQEQWVAPYNGPYGYDDYASGFAIDRSGDVYVTGATHQSDVYYDYDFATIKYTQPRLRPTPAPRPTRAGLQGDAADFSREDFDGVKPTPFPRPVPTSTTTPPCYARIDSVSASVSSIDSGVVISDQRSLTSVTSGSRTHRHFQTTG